MSRQLRMMAIEENATVQAVVGEGLDMLLRARGKLRWCRKTGQAVKLFPI
jgi:hypothetical protein